MYTTGVDVASADALATTLYGRTLLLKSGVFAAIGLVGLGNALLLQRGRVESRWLPRGLRAEAVLMVAILLPAAVLLSTAPARGPRVDAAPGAGSRSLPELRSLDAGDLIVSLSVKPNVPGTNVVSVDVVNTRRPAPQPVRSVDVAVARPGSAIAWRGSTRFTATTWQLADARFPHGGRWPVRLRIRRDSLPDQIVRASWNVPRAPLQSPAETALSVRPLAPIANWLAALTAAAFLLGGLAVTMGRLMRTREKLRRSSATNDGSRVNVA